MRAYILRRLLLVVPSFLGITFIVFSVMMLTPGDPARLALGMHGELATEKTRVAAEEMRELYGLNKPKYQQYLIWLKNIVTLNFGKSTTTHQPISEKIAQRLPITLALNVCALTIVYVVAIPIGVFAAVKQNSFADRVITFVLFLLYSMPAIWLGTMAMVYLGGTLGWFPIGGKSSPGHEDMTFVAFILDRLWHMVLPVTVMTYAGFASLSRYMRSSMLEVIRQDYIRTARAKGLRERTVILRHALRNSLIPIVTISIMAIPGLLGGSVIVESIFNINGMGLMFLEAVLKRDYYTVMALSTVGAFLVLLCLILMDVMYAVVDPRISYD